MPILPLTEENFGQEVLQAEGPVLVDLFAAWCGPCRALAPVLDALAEARPELRIGKVDVDAQPELAARFDVLTVPTLLLFRSGRLLRRTTGAKTLTELEEFLRSGEACDAMTWPWSGPDRRAARRLSMPPAPGWTCSFSSGSAPAGRWRRRSTLRITPAFRTAQTEPRWQTA